MINENNLVNYFFLMEVYSLVKTSYHFLIETLIFNDHLKVEGSWTSLWNLKIPPKIKHFATDFRLEEYPIHLVATIANLILT